MKELQRHVNCKYAKGFKEEVQGALRLHKRTINLGQSEKVPWAGVSEPRPTEGRN